MSGDAHSIDSATQLSLGDRVDLLCDRFETEWSADDPPRIEDYLTEVDDANRSRLLHELLLVELEMRQDQDVSAVETEFRARFPDDGCTIAGAFADVRESDDATQPDGAPGSETPQQIGRYLVVSHLGSGGQAEVYRGVHRDLGHEVVIKLCHRDERSGPEWLARMRQEGRILAEMTHENLVRVVDFDVFDGRPFLVMQHVDGVTLDQYQRVTQPSLRTLAGIVADLADALEFAHRRGVLHLDVKPANILVDAAGSPKLIDFGLARRSVAWMSAEKSEQGLVGTLTYMPPEQARGDSAAIGPHSDQYALGGVLYRLLTGCTPIAAGSFSQVLDRARNANWDRNALDAADAPQALKAICRRAMLTAPAERFASLGEMAQQLRRFVQRPRTRAAIAAALAGVMLTAAVYFAATQPTAEGDDSTAPATGSNEPSASSPGPSLDVRVLVGEEYRKLSEAPPLKNGVRLYVQFAAPAETFVTLYLLDSTGKLHELTSIAADDENRGLRFPPFDRGNVPLIGPPGNELLIACGRRSSKPEAGDVQRLLDDVRGWPTLPAGTVLRVTDSRVIVERPGEAASGQVDAEGVVRRRLQNLRQLLLKHFDYVEALAYVH